MGRIAGWVAILRLALSAAAQSEEAPFERARTPPQRQGPQDQPSPLARRRRSSRSSRGCIFQLAAQWIPSSPGSASAT